jgi:Fic family protein
MAMEWNPNKPYQDLPQLPPEADIETKAILRQCIKARAALAELKQAGQLIPNPAIMINTLPALEARASSEIENVVTTTDKLFQFAQDEEHADPATKEALRYSRALFDGFESLNTHPLGTRAAERICTQIRGYTTNVRTVPGTALTNPVSGEIIYTPPEIADHLRNLLTNWERFLHNDDQLDPLIRMAVAHYQFEAIHPFTDGNGRTGRVINSLYLIEQNLLTLPILYLSRYIIQNRNDYYRLLLDVTVNQSWEAWILYMLRAVEETANWTAAKIVAIRALSDEAADYIKSKRPKIYSRELVDVIFKLPYCRISNLVEAGVAKRQTASDYLWTLVEIGVLKPPTTTKDKVFIHENLRILLTTDENNLRTYSEG